ncbi:MAG: hypothetical protein U0797_28730 [Gemmataceae bacterium]
MASGEKDPYQVRLVVHVERHPQLTKVFRERVARELGDGLQAALGAAARVEVTDSHPELANIRRHGLQRALDGYRERSGEHTHFVLIDFSGTHYRVQSRLHDGVIGLPSPVVRSTRTDDREYVAREAAFLLERDLGLLGTVETGPDAAGVVRVSLKAGGLGVDLSRWVRKGEVFRLVRVGGVGPGQAEEWTYLQVTEPARDGACVCKLYSRYRQPRVAGLRAELLGTRTGPLRLRLLQERAGGGVGPLESQVRLELRHHGFEGEETSRLSVTAMAGRDIDTRKRAKGGQFDRLAFVTVLTGETVRARVPVPILDDGLTVLIVPASSAEGDLIAQRFRGFQRRVLDAFLVQAEQFRQFNELIDKPDGRAEALAAARKTLDRLRQDHTELSVERDEVMKEVAKLPEKELPPGADGKVINERLELIKAGEADLLKRIDKLEQIEKEENDPKKKEWLIQVERAKGFEKEGEVGKALAIYEKAPEKFVTEALTKHVEHLKKVWEPKGEEHKLARDFLVRTFPNLSTEELESRLKEAESALAVCAKADDSFGVTRLLRAVERHAKRMVDELNKLKPDVNFDDEKPATRIKELVPRLQKLDRDARAVLESKAPPAKEDD